MSFEVPNYSLEEWIGILKPYQKQAMDILLAANPHDLEKVAENYLSANGPTNTVPFGGAITDGNTKTFFNRFKAEFDKFVCGHEDYKQYYPQLEAKSADIRLLLVASISSAIGTVIGISGTLITPAIVLLLSIVGKMTRNAYCADKGCCTITKQTEV
jgi:hypothetical protein